MRNITNIAVLLKQSLPADIYRVIRRMGSEADKKGIPAYIVGGFVRDMLLGVKNLDIDIVIEGNALSFVKTLQKSMDLQVTMHKEFATAIVTLPAGFKIDFASARREEYSYPAALPKVSLSSLDRDLERRDFSINTLAVQINRRGFGRLIDPFNGRQDLRRKRVRILHEKSFLDDPTRILRAVRYEQRYNFAIEKHSRMLIQQALDAKMLARLSKFRLGRELILILKENNPLKGLLRLSSLCGLKNIHPLLKLDRPMIQEFKNARSIISRLQKNSFPERLQGWLIYFMLLTSGFKPEELKKLCRQYSLTKGDTNKVVSFRKNAALILRQLAVSQTIAPHRIYQILSGVSNEAAAALFCRSRERRARARIKLFLFKLSGIKLEIGGRDLKALGLKPGPGYRSILEKVLCAKLDGRIGSRREEIEYVKSSR